MTEREALTKIETIFEDYERGLLAAGEALSGIGKILHESAIFPYPTWQISDQQHKEATRIKTGEVSEADLEAWMQSEKELPPMGIGDDLQQYEDDRLYYQEVGEGIKRFQR